MSDTTKPTLSLEEELNVLEAVYKVGKEKGLDLLRPEQIKKLMEARGEKINGTEKKTPISKVEFVRSVNFIVDALQCDLMTQWQKETPDVDWAGIPKESLKGMLSDYFAYKYNISPYQLKELLIQEYEE